MPPEYLDRIIEFITIPLYVGTSADDLEEEIDQNTVYIGASDEDRATITVDDFERYFKAVIENRRTQLAASPINHGMLFHLWHDVQAGQLRFSLVSDLHEKLPFGAKLNILDTPRPIIEDFLSGSSVISWNELVYTGEQVEEEPQPEFILNIYVVKLEK